jgi:hypothetical protein
MITIMMTMEIAMMIMKVVEEVVVVVEEVEVHHQIPHVLLLPEVVVVLHKHTVQVDHKVFQDLLKNLLETFVQVWTRHQTLEVCVRFGVKKINYANLTQMTLHLK